MNEVAGVNVDRLFFAQDFFHVSKHDLACQHLLVCGVDLLYRVDAHKKIVEKGVRQTDARHRAEVAVVGAESGVLYEYLEQGVFAFVEVQAVDDEEFSEDAVECVAPQYELVLGVLDNVHAADHILPNLK